MKPIRLALLAPLFLLFIAAAFATDAVNKSGALAIKGYDPVAYFTDGRAIEGKRDFSLDWNDAQWRFASREHRELFRKNPARYAPQYGGYCAFGVSQGHAAPVDPKAWKIVDGKLYLNYNRKVQQMWLRDVPGSIEKADRNWPAVLEKK